MAEGFEYFTHESPGAPSLTSARGSFITLLDWVLVAKGGWEKAFTGTNLAAYRSQSGNRFYLRVDDQARFARIRGYRNMTAISTGTQPFPSTAQAPTATYAVPRAYVAGNAPRRFWGIRTNRYVKIFIEHYAEGGDDNMGQSLFVAFAFGDVPSMAEGDGFNTVICAMQDGSDVSGTEFFTSQCTGLTGRVGSTGVGLNTALYYAGNPAGNLISIPANISAPFGHIYAPPQVTVTAIGTSGRLHYSEYLLLSANQVDGQSGCYIRGAFPGVYLVFGGGYGQPDSRAPVHSFEEFSQNGRDFIALPYGSGTAYLDTYTSQLLLQKNDTGQVL